MVLYLQSGLISESVHIEIGMDVLFILRNNLIRYVCWKFCCFKSVVLIDYFV